VHKAASGRRVVGGIDEEAFAALADEASKGCPMPAAMHGNVDLTVNATLIPR